MFTRKDIVVLGMMIFALFLGAGNIIFPPMEGFTAGTQWATASLGFVLTGVFMPFITLVVVAIVGRGEELTRDLPKWAEVVFLATLYLVIGSLFAMPRVTNVAYEMAWLPLNIAEDNSTNHLIFSLVFNIIGMLFMLRPNTIISTVGKFMTPALLVLLVVVAVNVMVSPLSDIVEPTKAYATNPAITSGLISGYQTMDVLAAIAFGGIVARALAVRNISSTSQVMKYTISAGLISVFLLAVLYFSLFYLGATSEKVAESATNGGQIFSRYVDALFGSGGTWIMSGIIILANLTTLVGVTSACADYFAKFHVRLSYSFWVIVFTALTTTVAQTGLTELLRITIPALLLIYPVAIMLVFLQIIRHKLPNIKFTYYFTLLATVSFSACDSLKNMDLLPQPIENSLNYLPLYADGMGWLIPAFVALGLSLILSPKTT
ncbi:branched-chain amino acid transport system II carrier protein [Rodentibacter trehalosifermentans]|uniref:Branched-chain amino acid transport system carrier protein n=1 Tax=Rodentibacter trehalosifermentans TaxID=1908263 RepID=A0A1V3IUB9_9PAST|nr:branched-chain amino acid transport system II carrier protein [Rodentibacter trehalosifermentans]OOF45848.1 branched-chain amino acid transport system II carrier protein [Rodentibacter trehalosifermentans]OOF50236.1 branched-chain amino acid transport system II carrier protein [Rodentibacter trehalosifermentans]OOF52902.1 branched-chain amino acid transport system II carrier protein [Rodentibacter trehalosifermentans]